MGRVVGVGDATEYLDNSPFCQGYRDGAITPETPAPECWASAVYDTGFRITDTVTAKKPGFPWWIVLVIAGGVIVLKKSQR